LAAANHIVSSYLILYGKPDGLVEAPTLRIQKVSKGSAAQKAGLKVGDYLFSYDSMRVFSVADIGKAKSRAQDEKKESVMLVVFRKSERIEIEFPTGQMGISVGGP
ncbi:MAG: PDZ domain-containing protein, partial [Planctomycetota bacterium]